MIRDGIKRLFSLQLRRRRDWERQVEDEIRLHLELRAEQLAVRGLAPADASAEAIRRFGPLAESRSRMLVAAQERENQMKKTEYLDELRTDVRFSLRSLARQPSWTIVTVLTLALGIAATTAVWSAGSTLLLHPNSYPGASRIALIHLQPAEGNRAGVDVTITPQLAVVRAWRESSRLFEALEPFWLTGVTLQSNGDGARLVAARVLPSFATFAGERALIGRNISPSDIAARAPVVALGEAFWRKRFSGDSSIIGKQLTISGSPLTVIGVMPAQLKLPRVGATPPDIWLPLDMADEKGQLGVSMVGRLRPGASADAAARELDSINARSGAYRSVKDPFRTVVMAPGRRVQFRDSLLLLSAAVGLVLIVACANVAHLMLSRSVDRHRELAIRSALGAGRARLLRQLLTESAILTGAGTTLGIGLGYVGLRVMVALRPASLTPLRDAHLDVFALSIIVGASLVSGVAFGLVAAINPWRQGAAESLRGVGAAAGRGGDRIRSVLVVSEMAMSAVLLVGAVLLVRTVVNLNRSDLGYDPTSLYSVDLSLPKSRFPDAESKGVAIAEVEAQLSRVAGVKSMSITSTPPGSRSFNIGVVEVDGEPTPPNAPSAFVDVAGVSPGYFHTVGARLVEGRTFRDTSAHSTEIVINAGFARRHWPGQSALGHRMRVTFKPGQGEWQTIVGVVADISVDPGSAELGKPILYSAMRESESPTLMVRTDGSPAALVAIERAARSLGPEIPPTVQRAEATVADSIGQPKFVMTLLAVFTILALSLASIGLYGVMAHAVVQRTREIGIRMALGATAQSIARSVVGRGVALASVGAALGLVLAAWGTRVIQSSLYGVERLDVASFAIGAAVLVLSAVVACIAPTRRAVTVDPITAIRAD